jgi:LPS-assembly protein
LDSGVFFERESAFGNWGYLQTLEPRIYYLYVPYKDQSSLPVFDTGLLGDSLAQLFRENRFSGPDRQGDANQITTAVTTRFIGNDSGRERLSATIGQLYYLDNRRVNLSGNNVTTASRSDIFAEVSIYPWDNTTISTIIQRDTNLHQISKTSTSIQYQKDARHILNASYRYQDNSLNQGIVSAIWPISSRWSTVAHWEYSFKDDGNTLEGIAGIQYDTCCWSARFVYRNYFLGTRDNNSLFLQLSLKGLTRIGEGIESLLEEKISGYEDFDSVQ